MKHWSPEASKPPQKVKGKLKAERGRGIIQKGKTITAFIWSSFTQNSFGGRSERKCHLKRTHRAQSSVTARDSGEDSKGQPWSICFFQSPHTFQGPGLQNISGPARSSPAATCALLVWNTNASHLDGSRAPITVSPPAHLPHWPLPSSLHLGIDSVLCPVSPSSQFGFFHSSPSFSFLTRCGLVKDDFLWKVALPPRCQSVLYLLVCFLFPANYYWSFSYLFICLFCISFPSFP